MSTTEESFERQAIALMPAIERIARGMSRSLPSHVSVDDLVGAGNLGLVQAMRHYEPRPDVAFEAYALCRVRGAMLDQLRDIDPLTRRQRRALSDVDRALHRLRTRLDREPSAEEVAEESGMTLQAYASAVTSARSRQTVSLSSGHGKDDEMALELPVDDVDAETLTLARDDAVRIATAMDRLPARMRRVLHLYFEEGKKLREVAVELGVSQTRVHQLRQEAVDRVQKSYHSASVIPMRRPALGAASASVQEAC